MTSLFFKMATISECILLYAFSKQIVHVMHRQKFLLENHGALNGRFYTGTALPKKIWILSRHGNILLLTSKKAFRSKLLEQEIIDYNGNFLRGYYLDDFLQEALMLIHRLDLALLFRKRGDTNIHIFNKFIKNTKTQNCIVSH